MSVITGTDADDTLIGSNFDADTISGLGGDDYLAGGEVNGGACDDLLLGGDGDDTLYGADGADTLNGGTGIDVLYGDRGADRLIGGEDTDTVVYLNSPTGPAKTGVTVNLATGEGAVGYAAGDTLSGIEKVIGSRARDSITGDDGDNHFTGHGGSDTLDGAAGDDTLVGGRGADVLIGGDGIDTAVYSSFIGVTINLETGETSGGHAKGDVLSEIENLSGTGARDSLTGDEEDNVLVGNGSADTLQGAGGDDTLSGGQGSDFLFGGAGDDVLWGSTRVYGSIRFQEWQDGGDGDDTLFGGNGNDTLSGGNGDDRLHGGGGADQLDGDDGTDTVDYTLSNVGVNVNLQTGVNEGGQAEGDTLSNIENIAGTHRHDSLTGDDADNMLTGSGGWDTLTGGAGDDTVMGENGHDLLMGGEGDDLLDGGNHNDTLVGGMGDDTLTGGSEGDLFVFAGGSGDDVVTDFTVNRDTLDLSATNTDFTDLASIQAASTETSSGVLIDLGGGDSVLLEGISLDDLSAFNIEY